jgi:NAD/NADP transhydrogenase alpha subunit
MTSVCVAAEPETDERGMALPPKAVSSPVGGGVHAVVASDAGERAALEGLEVPEGMLSFMRARAAEVGRTEPIA